MKAYFLKAYSLSKIHCTGQIKSPVVICYGVVWQTLFLGDLASHDHSVITLLKSPQSSALLMIAGGLN